MIGRAATAGALLAAALPAVALAASPSAVDGPITYGPLSTLVARLGPIVVTAGIGLGLWTALSAIFDVLSGKRRLGDAAAAIVGALVASVFLVIVLRYWTDAANWLINLIASTGSGAVDGRLPSLPDGFPSIPPLDPAATPVPSVDPGFPSPPLP